MLTMDKVHSIRQLYYEQGKNIPTIIAETGYDRKTICKYARCQEQVNDLCYNICIIERRSGVVSDCEMPSSIQGGDAL